MTCVVECPDIVFDEMSESSDCEYLGAEVSDIRCYLTPTASTVTDILRLIFYLLMI